MANQMIALGVRGPQLPNIGGIAQQYANVMANVAAAREKQGAAQRANQFRQLVQGGLDVTTPEGYSQIAGLDPEGAAALRKSALDTQAAQAKLALDFLGASQEELSRANTPDEALAVGRMLKQAYPMFAQNIDETLKTLPADPSEFSTWRQNTNMSALKSADRMQYFLDKVSTESIIGEGGDVGVLTRGGMNAPTIKTPRTLVPAPARTGTVTVEPSETVEPGVGGPVNANEVERFILSFPPEAQAAIRARVNQGALGNIPMGSPVPTGLVAGERGGVGGPDEGYVEAPRPFRAKNPMQSPMPGSAIVPLPRLAAEKTVETRAQKAAELEAERAKAAPAKQRVSTIIGKMKGAYEALDKAEAIPSEKRGGFANALDYLATSALGREAQRLIGTEQSKNLTQITNLRKQLATAIKNATGMSAQEMNSNVELQLMLDTLSDPTQGIEAARQTLSDLEELYGAPKPAARPAPAQRRTPTRRTNIDALLKKYGD